jgi:hypothetical protein
MIPPKHLVKTVATAITILTLIPTPLHALSPDKLDFFADTGIMFYDPDATSIGCLGGGYSGTTTTSSGLSPEQVLFLETWHSTAETLSINYGIPWETVVAQGIVESGSGTSNFAINRNNFFGIGAYDANPNAAFSYDSPASGWEGYYQNIVKTSVYRANGVFQQPTITDPYAYLTAIKAAGYATNPNYIEEISAIISDIETHSKDQGWLSSAELATTYPEMLTNAAIYASDNATPTTPTASNCDQPSHNQDAQSLLQTFNTNYDKFATSGYQLNKNGCTTLTNWYITEYTTLTYGHGNGGAVVSQLVAANPGLEITDTPRAPGIFSTYDAGFSSALCSSSQHSSGRCGHTGIVVAVDGDIVTILDTSTSLANAANKATTKQYNISEIQGKFQFTYVGDYLK